MRISAEACLCRVCMFSPCMHGFSPGTLTFPPSKNMHVSLIGDSKLSLGVSVSVPGCVSVSPCDGLTLASCPMTAGIGSSPTVTLDWVKQV